jgi:uncharacterized membrane protein YcaP (DUF421 family)
LLFSPQADITIINTIQNIDIIKNHNLGDNNSIGKQVEVLLKMSLFIAISLRGFITYIMLLLFFRMMGPRQLSQFTFKDYVLGVLLGSIGGRAITRLEQGYLTFFYGMAIITVIQVLVSYMCLKSDKVRRFVNGGSIIVIDKGEVMPHNLKKARLCMNELASLLRARGIFNLSDVQYAILEPTRDFSVMLKSEKSPVTCMDLDIQTPPRELPVIIIKDGNLVYAELNRYNLTEAWVKEKLAKHNIHEISDVSLAQADNNAIVYVCVNKKD